MLELVTVADACAQIALDPPDSDGGDQRHALLAIDIQAVSEAVRGWLKDDWRLYLELRASFGDIVTDSDGDPVPETDSNGDPITHPVVRLAVLVEIASQFRFREGEGDNGMGPGYILSKTATGLLTARRKPTVR